MVVVGGHAGRGLFAAERPSVLGRGWSILLTFMRTGLGLGGGSGDSMIS